MGAQKRPRGWIRPARLWVPVTVFAVMGVALSVALNTPPAALVDRESLQVKPAAPTISFGRPTVTYEVGGAGSARVNYLAGTGELITEEVRLPWSYDVVLSSPMRPASVSVAATDGSAVHCSLSVDGTRRDRKTSSPGSGVVLCSVVSA